MGTRTAAPPVSPRRGSTAPGTAGTGDRLNRFFDDACDRTPAAPALECGARLVTYADLDAQANRVARHLHRVGIGPGSRAALLLPRSVDMYACLLGVCRVDRHERRARLAH
ncbi:AMP-binding protein, partial [Streptomyces carpinensis]